MNRLQTNKLITYLSPFHNEQTPSCLCLIASTRRPSKALQNQARWKKKKKNRSHSSYLFKCNRGLFAQPTREYIKASSLINMRHGLLATDAGLILPAHNYTHQQHLFCMDDGQLQIHTFPVWAPAAHTETTNSTQLPPSSVCHPSNWSDCKTPETASCIFQMSLFTLTFSFVLAVTQSLWRSEGRHLSSLDSLNVAV